MQSKCRDQRINEKKTRFRFQLSCSSDLLKRHLPELQIRRAKPASAGVHRYRADRSGDDSTFGYIYQHGEGLNGVPFKRKWKIPTFYVEKPLIPKPNFFNTVLGIVCDEKAREIAGEAMDMSGEFLPIRVEGEKGEYWIYNIVWRRDNLQNPARSRCTDVLRRVHR